MHGHNIGIIDPFPVLHCSDGFLICQAILSRLHQEVCTNRTQGDTFKSSESISIPVLARDGFIYPARIPEDRCVSLVADIQGYKRVEVVDLMGC
jgi:hypothetical protein